MRYLFLFLGIVFLFPGRTVDATSFSTNIGTNLSSAVLVRVRIASKLSQIKLTGQGISHQAKGISAVAIPSAQGLEVRLKSKENKNFLAVRDPSSSIERLTSAKLLEIKGSDLHYRGRPVPSRLYVVQNGQGIDLIGILPMDKYLLGVLSKEVPANWPLETLKAQAVAARTYALSVMGEKKSASFDLESSVLDQVFSHVSEEDKVRKFFKLKQAIQQTEGLVVRQKNGALFKTYFHADCGGESLNANDVWGSKTLSEKQLKNQPKKQLKKLSKAHSQISDPSCATSRRGQWTAILSKKQIEEKVGLESLNSIQAEYLLNQQRVEYLKLAFNTKEVQLTGNELREKFGYNLIKSTNFKIKELAGDRYLLSGRGHGHGVGLCQWGSKNLGEAGKSFRQILSHYYPETLIRR